MSHKKSAVLLLADGTQFKGFSFGAERSVVGEVVFNTAMLGYPELLSDPASRGHILVMTYPLIGNYGVPPHDSEEGLLKNFESDRLQISGLVVTDYSDEYSHWNAAGSLGEWLRENNVPAICGVDTRELARHIRENGEMGGKIVIDGTPEVEPERQTKTPETFGNGDVTVAIIGEGIKNNVIRSLLRRGVKVTTDSASTCDGLVVTGCPDDPKKAEKVIRDTELAFSDSKPVFGVCGGDTILALAAGGDVRKLKHGHRGSNQPVLEAGTDHASITTQNHGWAVDAEKLPAGWEVWYTNLNDDTPEGIRHKTKPFCAVSFHPEATGNPVDADKLYNDFVARVRSHKK